MTDFDCFFFLYNNLSSYIIRMDNLIAWDTITYDDIHYYYRDDNTVHVPVPKMWAFTS